MECQSRSGKKEIENHLRKHAKEAASKIKKLTKEGQNL